MLSSRNSGLSVFMIDSSPPVPAISRPCGLPSSTMISAGSKLVITVGALPAFGFAAATAASDANSPRAGIPRKEAGSSAIVPHGPASFAAE